ncbi:MAG: hypothetical protein K0R90_1507 [Oscillospiraceae bacterium]|jgi:uncharacterized protein|nr:hypothetical protein [Oscillospiraceae bacterium]
MLMELKQLFDIIGESQEIDYQLDLSEYELWESKPFITPVQIKGTIGNRTGIVSLNFTCDFTMRLNCDRCLTEFDRGFSYKFEHFLVTKINTQDYAEYIIVEDYQLDLDELVLSDILLNLPSKLLCDEECKGLCPNCGSNLNTKDCQCKKTTVDPRLETLGKLLT